MSRLLPMLLLLPGCPSDKTNDSNAIPACLTCPDLLAMPCNKGADATVDYYYCDPCGNPWRCTLTGLETHDFLDWSVSDRSCACIKSDGTLDNTDPSCAR